MLIEEENMEIEMDEAEKLQGTQTTFPDQNYLPHTGVSSDVKKQLAFRSQYCFSTLQYKEDDPELKQEGFIVADDYFSQDSSLEEGENHDAYEHSRKELLIKQLERHENRIRSVIRPYILLVNDYDLGDYKAINLKQKLQKQPLSRMSFGIGHHEGPNIAFPISVLKLKKVEIKLEIKDVIEKLVELGHGSTIPKKQLAEQIKKDHADLKKGHIETFVKECFDKKKLDSKVR